MARRGEDWGRWGHYPGLLFLSHPEDRAIGGGGREFSRPYQQDSTQPSNRWVPETAGGKGRVDGWATSKERKREDGAMEKKRQCLYRLGYIKWQLLSSSVHNWVEILLVRWDECRLCPTAYCWWWNIEICITSLFATAAGAILKASLRRDGMLKDPVVWVSVSSLKFLQICHVSCY